MAAGIAAVGHRDHQVRLGRMLDRQLPPHPQPRLVQEAPADDAVRPRQVDELEDAQPLAARRSPRRSIPGREAWTPSSSIVRISPGLHVAHERGAHGVERDALRGHRPAGRAPLRGRAAGRAPAGGSRSGPAPPPPRAGGEHREGEGADARWKACSTRCAQVRPGAWAISLASTSVSLAVTNSTPCSVSVVAQPGGVGQVAVVAQHQLAELGSRRRPAARWGASC